MLFERPRVRAEGPGGPDVKQGARIACLDCRSAKIRCSAPTDGKVPCKRCARHGRECVFEKHRRGRKPGRTNNVKSLEHNGSESEMDSITYGEGDSQEDLLPYGGGGGGGEGHSNVYHPQQHHMANDAQKYAIGMGSNDSAYSARRDASRSYLHTAAHHHAGESSAGVFHSTAERDGHTQHAYPPFHPHHQTASSWRQPLSSDDPRLVSPNAGHAHRTSHMKNAHHQTQARPHDAPLLPSSQNSSPYARPSNSPPHMRDGRTGGMHPSYLPYGNTSSAEPATLKSSTSPASPFMRPSAAAGEHRSLNLHLGNALPPPKNDGAFVQSAAPPPSSSTPGHLALNTPLTVGKYGEQAYSPPTSGLPPPSLGSGATPGRSWLDFPTPGTRSLLSPSHMLSTSISTFPSSNGSLSNAWPGSAITSPHKRKGPTDYFAGAIPQTTANGQDAARGDQVRGATEKKRKHANIRESAERADHSAPSNSPKSSLSLRHAYSEDEEEHIDHMDEDEVGGLQDGEVLSTPLRLLAHASDAALALRQAKGGADSSTSQRSTSLGAATMGLVSPPVPSLPAPRKWIDFGRLPSMSLSTDASRSQIGFSGSLLPKLASVAQRRDIQRASNSIGVHRIPDERRFTRIMSPQFMKETSSGALPPPGLGSLGRSRSYTAVDSASAHALLAENGLNTTPHLLPSIPSMTVTQVERRAEVLGIHTDAEGRQMEIAGTTADDRSVTATTLDPDAWEYKNGRVRSRKSISAGQSTVTGTGSGKTSEEDAVVASKEADTECTHAADNQADPVAKKSLFRRRLDSMENQRRWEVVRRRPSKTTLVDEELDVKADDAASQGSSDESEKLGASHQDFFSMSIYHSKMDNVVELDPVECGLIELSELEKLFDLFFARINPLLTVFDPFLHSVTYVRNRSALLTTVIGALAARLSDTGRDAKLAMALENHWRQRLLPEALLGGYKSVEIAQAFLVLAMYHKPTNRMSEDRSWQYLGFAIRTATEIGINRTTQPSDEAKDNEQVRRRMRNRSRLWINLWLTDRSMSLQTGRPFTIVEDSMITNSDLWHREHFALPDDARLVGLIKLLRIVTTYCNALGEMVTQHNAILRGHLVATAGAVVEAQEALKSLNFGRVQATAELVRWKEIWCVEALDESNDGIQTLAIGTCLDKWRPRAKIDVHYARLHLNSIVLEALERHQSYLNAAAGVASTTTSTNDETESRFDAQLDETKTMIDKVANDCWDTSLRMINILLSDVSEEDLAAGPNALSVNVIYGALAALRLSSSAAAKARAWADRDEILRRCKSLAEALIKAGRTPEHRNGAAAPFGIYLKGIVMVWETESVGVASQTAPVEKAGEVGKDVLTDKHGNTKASEANDAGPASDETKTIGESSSASTAQSVAPTVPVEKTRPQLHQQHSVGDDVWGSSSSSYTRHRQVSGSNGLEDPSSMDRMWDYLTTYPDPIGTFPMSLWQPQVANNNSTSAPASAFTTANIPMTTDGESLLASSGLPPLSAESSASADAAAAAAAAAASVGLAMAHTAQRSSAV